ncbi:MAG: hypothetical protein QM773_12470 [Hyphomonadaceae bacterium]
MMQIGEARISAIAVSILTGIGLTLMLNSALRDLSFATSISVPVTLVMGAVLFLFASDDIKKGGREPPDKQAPERANEGK